MKASSKRVCGSMDSRGNDAIGQSAKGPHVNDPHVHMLAATSAEKSPQRSGREAHYCRRGGRRLSMRLDSPPVTSTPSIAASSAGAEPLPLIQYCFRTYGGAGLLHSTRLTALYTPNDPPAVF